MKNRRIIIFSTSEKFMISEEYSECNHCLGEKEKALKKKYKAETLKSLLHKDIPQTDKAVIIESIKPDGPGDTSDWLSGRNINECNEYIYNHYDDNKLRIKNKPCCDGITYFDCISEFKFERERRHPQLFQFKMRDTIFENVFNPSKYNCSGFVINIDYNSGSGIHWIAIFINHVTKPYTLECFDSAGDALLPEVSQYFSLFGSEYQPILVCSFAQQNDDHSCGPYSLYYIYSRLQGVPWQHFRKYKIGDKQMHKFRKHLFSLG
jgi:hypothetical protein